MTYEEYIKLCLANDELQHRLSSSKVTDYIKRITQESRDKDGKAGYK